MIKLCQSAFSDGQNIDLSQMIQERFKYATRGLLYKDMTFYKNKRLNYSSYLFPDGKNADLSLKARIYFRDSKRNSFCKLIYRGWVNNNEKPDGYGRMIWNSHRKYKEYTGEWKNGKFSGEGVLTYSNGDIVSGIWKDGRLIEKQ